MLFFENIHFQIAAVLVILVLQILYWSQKKLPLLSTTCFSFMMFWSAVYIVADFAVVFSLAFPREVSHIARRFFHQLFYFSIENVCLFLYLYVTFLLKKQERLKAFTWISVIVPYALTILALVFSPIKYVIGSDAIYPAGPMVRQMLFLSSIIYAFCAGKNFVKLQKKLPSARQKTLHRFKRLRVVLLPSHSDTFSAHTFFQPLHKPCCIFHVHRLPEAH